ncbi:MAG: site-2 protease family protein [Brevinematia bacterium]
MVFTDILNIAIVVVGIIYSIILHEVAHGFVALLFGDDTAKLKKRLSLNPVRHIDPIGTLLLPLILFILKIPVFGWAKPVPINPLLFKNRRVGIIFVSIAGVMVNFLLMIIMFFLFSRIKLEAFIILASLNLMLAIFNLLPFPPLDGYRFFSEILPSKVKYFLERFENIFLVIFLFLIVTGLIRYIYMPVYKFVANFFLSLFLGGS